MADEAFDPLKLAVYPDEEAELTLDPSQYEEQETKFTERIEALKALIMEIVPNLEESEFKQDCEAQGEFGDLQKNDAFWPEKIKNSTSIVDEMDFDKLEPLVLECTILIESEPKRLAQFYVASEENATMWDSFIGDPAYMKRFVCNGYAFRGRYYKALQIHQKFLNELGVPDEGIQGKLALAIALEFAKPIQQFRVEAQIDPFARFEHYKTAFENGELYREFENYNVWELRHAVCSDASNEELQWGRDHLKRFRPDEVRVEAPHLKYSWSYNTTLPRPQMHKAEDYKGILSGGGACGPQSWWSRFICRAFGWPVWGVIQPGHAAMSKWVPKVGCWDTYQGSGFKNSRWVEPRWYAENRTKNLDRHGNDFDEDSRARFNGVNDDEYYKKVTLTESIASVNGEGLEYPWISNTKLWRQVSICQRRMIAKSNWKNPPAELSHWPKNQDLLPGITPKFETTEKIVETSDGHFTIPSSLFSFPPPGDMQVQRQDFDLEGWGAAYKAKKGHKEIAVMPSYELGTGNQMWHVVDKKRKEFHFMYDIPESVPEGAYAVSAKFVTVHQDQIPLHISGVGPDGTEEEKKSVDIPNTVGEWSTSDPVVVNLQPGGKLKFTRYMPGEDEVPDHARFRLVLKEFYLVKN